MRMPSLMTPLRNQRFAAIFSGQLLSDFGNWLDLIALQTLLVYSWKLGPGAIAGLLLAMGAPWILLGPLLGVLADRVPFKLVLLISDLLRAALVLGLFFAPSLWMVLVLVFLKSTVAACFEPARMRAIRELMEPDMLSRAVSLSQISVYLTKIAAPALGGFIASVWNPSLVFLIEMMLFLISALVLSTLPGQTDAGRSREGAAAPVRFRTDFLGGYHHIRSSRGLGQAVLFMSTALFLIFMFEGLFALWSHQQQLSERTFGMLVSAVGLGSLAGAFGGGLWEFWRSRPMTSMSVSTASSGLLVALLGLAGLYSIELPAAGWILLAFFAGLSAAFSSVPYAYILQMETPAPLIGRVSGTAGAIQNMATLAAPAAGALLAGLITANGVFLAAGLGMVLLFGGMAAILAGERKSTGVQQAQGETPPVDR